MGLWRTQVHENAILVSCSFRGRDRNRDRNRPFGIHIIDPDADTDSDPEVSRFLPLFSKQPSMGRPPSLDLLNGDDCRCGYPAVAHHVLPLARMNVVRPTNAP